MEKWKFVVEEKVTYLNWLTRWLLNDVRAKPFRICAYWEIPYKTSAAFLPLSTYIPSSSASQVYQSQHTQALLVSSTADSCTSQASIIMVSKYDRPTLAGHGFHWPIIALEFLCGLLVLAFSAAVIAQHNANTASIINYEVFLGIIILLWVFAFAAAPFVPVLGQEIFRVPADLIMLLLTFAGGVALAVRLRVHSCSSDSYKSVPLFNGSANQCRLLQAACAFTWFAFGGFLFTTIVGVFSFISGKPATQRGSRKPRAAPATV